MDLQEFVSQTLIQIAEGVAAARAKKGELIAPKIELNSNTEAGVLRAKRTGENAFLVEFDVAVGVAETSAASGGGGIQVVAFFNAKGEKAQTIEASSVNRVKFVVPMSYG
jgi:hypothetical protein